MNVRAQWWVVVLCLLPLVYLVHLILGNHLSVADPGRDIVKFLGLWSLRLLLVCLTIRPLCDLLSSTVLFPCRRTVGLCALLYISLHALAWASFLVGWSIDGLITEIIESPYVLVGMLALILLIPLGVTSTRRARRALGAYWQRLHTLIYPSAVLACIHFLWLSKDWITPILYTSILFALLLLRIIIRLSRARLHS